MPRNLVYVAPFPMQTTLRFSRALAGLSDVRLFGVFHEPPKGDAAGVFDDAEVVRNAFDPAEVVAACRRLEARHGPIFRVLGILEDLQVQLAAVRAELGVAGPDVRTATAFRDKAQMKDLLRAAGLPCARHRLLRSDRDGWAFADQVGLPMVLKPPAGAGCKATYRVSSPQELHRVLAEVQPAPQRPVLAEEFLTGAEFSFETLTVGGQVRFSSISRYFPSPLEVVENPWIQWAVVLPRDLSGETFERARSLGVAAVQALQLEDGMTHMEWFRRPDGSLAIGEVAARPPGARIVPLTGLAHVDAAGNSVDIYRAWARAVVDGAFDGPWERRYSTGCAFLRGQGRGRIVAVEGLAEAQEKMGALVVDRELPKVGWMRSDSYEGEGWVIVRHPDTEVVKQALMDLITTVKVRYEA
ncbi:MAG: ATP-grasp domain-containing protein [Alphaproteobacteria bacterium]|nr:ATP-grasp domain-containing protein [Alphaproteobacteria bacterium]